MFKKSLKDAPEFIAGDATHLREILHPHKDPVKIGYSIAHAYLKPNKSSLLHRLNGSKVYHIIAGTGTIHIDENKGYQSAVGQSPIAIGVRSCYNRLNFNTFITH